MNRAYIWANSTGICHTDAYTLSGQDAEGVFPSILGHEGEFVDPADRSALANELFLQVVVLSSPSEKV